jgi:hypothetical protein
VTRRVLIMLAFCLIVPPLAIAAGFAAALSIGSELWDAMRQEDGQ